MVRNVHVCVSHGSSASSVTVRPAAHGFVVKQESPEVHARQYFQSFAEQVGRKRQLLIHPGIHGRHRKTIKEDKKSALVPAGYCEVPAGIRAGPTARYDNTAAFEDRQSPPATHLGFEVSQSSVLL